MADQLERTTNLLALLLESRVPLTLDDIVNQLGDQYPTGHAAMRGAFERDKACCATSACRWRPRC
jgi:hypothetical protein